MNSYELDRLIKNVNTLVLKLIKLVEKKISE